MNYDRLRKLFNELTDIVYRERIVVAIFIGFVILIKLSFYYLNKLNPADYEDLTVVQLDSMEEKDYFSNENISLARTIRLFSFNPAEASFEELVELGFSFKTANILINYRTKGGRFFKKEDVKKIYGVSPELYAKIEPYILISESGYSSKFPDKFQKTKPQLIDINSATLDQWKALPGIGDSYAAKFVSMKNGLGAFVSIDQIKDVYGLPDSTFQNIKPYLNLKPKPIKKININDASLAELQAHPYILRWQVDDIIKNRPIYGLDDLYELYTFKKRDNKWLEKYFEF